MFPGLPLIGRVRFVTPYRRLDNIRKKVYGLIDLKIMIFRANRPKNL
jgi:hypothetical protein